MNRLAYRVGFVTIAAFLTGPVMAQDEQPQTKGITTIDAQPGRAYPGDADDNSVINPDGGSDDDADGGSDQDDSQGDGDMPDTYPA